ncbi:DUF4864 domain-containing protein [Fulvimarina endophytica]|uniref:DUF4864 domain-containing protein n=2 Tax=Fulvimarina endophytica TaxID=2293836 RepID=A0A371X8F1_9HYPH|nr:DUF4864 domain-containing protein [Fulvimarina endophytica]
MVMTVLALVFATPARADDASDIRGAIGAQLQAFRADDGNTAFSYAAPQIQTMFGSEAMFMRMVRDGYPPVYRSSNVTFGDLTRDAEGFRQDVFMTDPNGQAWIADYRLERQADGSMKITGVSLRKSEDLAV